MPAGRGPDRRGWVLGGSWLGKTGRVTAATLTA